MWGEIDTSNDARCREVRRCAKCSQPSVTVYHVTQHYNRGMPTGRTYSHRCNSCQATFDSISTWRAMITLLSGAFIASIGFSFVSMFVLELFERGMDTVRYADGGRWGTWGFGALMLFGGVAWSGYITWLVARVMFLNPVAGTR